MNAATLFNALSGQFWFGFATREAMLKDDAVALAATQLVIALHARGIGKDDTDVQAIVREAEAGKVPLAAGTWVCRRFVMGSGTRIAEDSEIKKVWAGMSGSSTYHGALCRIAYGEKGAAP